MSFFPDLFIDEAEILLRDSLRYNIISDSGRSAIITNRNRKHDI